jgi:hypothetical protein
MRLFVARRLPVAIDSVSFVDTRQHATTRVKAAKEAWMPRTGVFWGTLRPLLLLARTFVCVRGAARQAQHLEKYCSQ